MENVIYVKSTRKNLFSMFIELLYATIVIIRIIFRIKNQRITVDTFLSLIVLRTPILLLHFKC